MSKKVLKSGLLTEKKNRSKIGKNSRVKGHNLERTIMKLFKEELDFEFAKTSRHASKMLDDCQVDISGIPFLIQTKSGYDKNRPKYEDIFIEIEERLLKNYPKEDKIHKYPKVIVHKITDRKKYHNFVIMPYNDFKALLLMIKPELHKM